MHDDALVAVAVGDVRLVGLRVDEDLRDAAEVLGVVAAAALALAARTASGTCRPRELQDVRVLVAVAADPDVVLVVDRDAVVRRRPLVALAGTAPVADELPAGSNSSTGGAFEQHDAGRRVLVGRGFGRAMSESARCTIQT